LRYVDALIIFQLLIMNKFELHVIDADTVVAKSTRSFVPSIGEELRFGGEGSEKYYTVTRVVWCFDEDGLSGQRVNIGVVKVTEF